MWNLELPDIEATIGFGRALGRAAEPGTLVALCGDLGAGKTSFAQGVGIGLHVQQPIVSPTFVLIAEYDEGRIPLLHADAYRLQPGESEAIGLDEAVDTWPGLVLIEWADKVESILPDDRLSVEIIHRNEGRRVIVQAMGRRHARVLEMWQEQFLG